MGMMRLGLLAMFLALPALALAEPTYHRVINVAPNDVLNVRAEPLARSADIGDLPHDAQRIEAFEFDTTGNWARIALNERDGWIATRFLTRDDVATLGDTTLPVGLICGGTEPFWALGLYGSDARYSHPTDGDMDFTYDSITVAEGRLGSPALVTVSTPEDTVIEATISGASCNDGMSDRSYGWTITLQRIALGQRRFLSGCCQLPRD